MREPDVRDERLGLALDRAVRDLRPPETTAGVVRTGRRRQTARVLASASVVAVFVAAVGWAGTVAGEDAGATVTFGSLATDGWTFSAPASWTSTPIDPCEMPDGTRTGAIVSNVPFEFRDPKGGDPSCEDRIVFDGFPTAGVALSYEPTGMRFGLFAPPLDTVLPFEPLDLQQTDSIRGGPPMSYHSVVVNGDLKAYVRLWIGAEASPSDREAIAEVLRSLDVAGAAHWTTTHIERTPPEGGPDIDVVYPDDWRVRAAGGIAEDTDVQPLLTLASPGTGESPCADGSLDPRDGVVVQVGWWTGGGWPGTQEPSFPDRAEHLQWSDGETSRVDCPIGQAERSTFRFTDGGQRHVVDVTLDPGMGLDSEGRSMILRVLDGLAFSEAPEQAPHVTFESPEAPWSFEYPVDWDVRTYEKADPSLRVNYLITTVANGPIPAGGPFRPDDRGLPVALGDAGAIVSIERFWSHATGGIGAGEFGPGQFSPDRSNEGWTWVERARCEGTLCWHVIEWLGPDVSDEDRAAAERLADSVRLADIDRWTETDGERTTLHDEEHGFTVTYPNDGWQVADENLTPWLSSPEEILSVGTFDMPVSQDPEDGLRPFDAPAAPAALQALGPSDAFVTVQESGPVESDDRPTAFESCADGERCGPTGSTDNFSWWWIPFRDAGRGLYLFAAIGNDASPEVVDQAWAMADSLRFLASPAA